MLEFLVWMVWGKQELEEFNKRIVNDFGKQVHYFELEKKNGQTSCRVHSAVSATMDKLAQHVECKAGNTALGDLLKLVRTRLLVVSLGSQSFGKGKTPQINADTQVQPRADSRALKMALDEIIERGNKNRSYWLKGESSDDLPSLCTPQVVESELHPQDVLTVAREQSSENVGGLSATESSSFVVPVLTGTVRVR